MRRGLQAAVVTALALAAASTAGAGADARFTLTATVTRVVDGDTLDVVLTSGKHDRVRLVGVDASERAGCFARQAAAHVRRLAQSKRVVLKGDGVQPARDRYDRLLAYVWLPGGKDLGYQLIAAGSARVYDAPVRVLGSDPYRLDGDGDGFGCD